MTSEESNARFAAAKEAAKVTGCAPTKGKVTKTWSLKELEQPLVYDGIPIGISRTGVGYEVKQHIADSRVYRHIKKTNAAR